MVTEHFLELFFMYTCRSLYKEQFFTSLNLCKGIPLRSTGDLSAMFTKRASSTDTAHSTCTHLKDPKQNPHTLLET